MSRKLTDAEQTFVDVAYARFVKTEGWSAAQARDARDAFHGELAAAGIFSTVFGYRAMGTAGPELL